MVFQDVVIGRAGRNDSRDAIQKRKITQSEKRKGKTTKLVLFLVISTKHEQS